MAVSEQSYSTTENPGYPNTHEAQENDIKPNLQNIIDAFKEETNKSFKEIEENTSK